MAEDVRTAIRKIFRSCQRLSELTGRPFSPDGHLVGSFGEVAAADLLNLTLMPPSNDGYDAIDKQGRRVEIKATTRSSIGLSTSGTKAERLVVVAIDNNRDETFGLCAISGQGNGGSGRCFDLDATALFVDGVVSVVGRGHQREVEQVSSGDFTETADQVAVRAERPPRQLG